MKNSAFVLDQAMQRSNGQTCLSTALVRDGHHRGTLFTWLGGEWAVTNLEGRSFQGCYDRLAVVTLKDGDAECGLNQASLGVDLEVTGGEWVVDADDLDDLRESHGDNLVVIWEQQP